MGLQEQETSFDRVGEAEQRMYGIWVMTPDVFSFFIS